MSEDQHYSRRRYEHREADTRPKAIAAWWMRWRGLVMAIPWTAIGAAIAMVVSRWFFADRLDAQDTRMTMMELRVELRDSVFADRFDRVDAGINILVKAECMRRTRYEQQRDGLPCPDQLYRGADRGGPP